MMSLLKIQAAPSSADKVKHRLAIHAMVRPHLRHQLSLISQGRDAVEQPLLDVTRLPRQISDLPGGYGAQYSTFDRGAPMGVIS